MSDFGSSPTYSVVVVELFLFPKGKKSLNEIKDILNGMGLDFGMEFDEQGNPIPGSGGRDATDLSDFEDEPEL